MGGEETDVPRVLIVDDEPDVADLYAHRLDVQYEVTVANDGTTALEILDSESVDVMLLDRRMNGITGDEVLETARETGHDCRIIMITAIDPDVDIVEMPFDDYLCKPIGRETLLEAIEHQLIAKEYGETIQELFSATAKLGVLRADKPAEELESLSEYQALKSRIETLRAENRDRLDELGDFEVAFNEIDRGPKQPERSRQR
ncbi:response regulator [Halonotius terrestris]|uniref:Response regulator n=1 Tax=Halonotius terrestris TaxID=2487750 RepID=A0A8J8PA96_9EURY|nr:response regulator [Halonotius terrestris]TQQ82761.1 response regulator [Halonotius terrestris]